MSELKTELRLALREIENSLKEAESERQRQLSEISQKTNKKIKKTIDSGNEILLSAAERVDRLILFQALLRNIKMNLTSFLSSNIELRPNQLTSIHKLIEFLKNDGYGGAIGYIKQPTGAGKTVLFGVIARLCGTQTLILVPKLNLLGQTKKELVEVVGFPDEMISTIGGGNINYEDAQVNIATYQSHRSLIKRNAKYRAHVQSANLIICDEAHRALGEKTEDSIDALDGDLDRLLTPAEIEAENDVLDNLDEYTPAQSLKLGFTATPKLANKHVESVFRHMIAEEKHADLVKAGILVGYRIVHTDGTITEEDLEDGTFTEEDEIKIMKRENTFEKLLGEYAAVLAKYRKTKKRHQYPLRAAAFCVNIAECDRFKKDAELLGLKAQIVTSRETKGMKSEDADALLAEAEKKLLNQEIDLIVTVSKLAEGWNFPPVNAAIWARASQSPALVVQGIGRTARSYTDSKGRKKDFSYVFETDWHMEDNSERRTVPLTIADAMAAMGENPEECCSMADGSVLELRPNQMIDANGIIFIENEWCIGVHAYAAYLGIKPDTLNWNIKNAEIDPFSRALSQRGQEIPVYKKEEIDDLSCVRNVIEAGDNEIDENAEILLKGMLCVGCPKYAVVVGTARNTLIEEIAEAKLQHIGLAKSGPAIVKVYKKTEVDQLKCVKNAIAVAGRILNDDAQIEIDGELFVGCPPYLPKGIKKPYLMKLISERNIPSMGKARSRNYTTNLYLKADIDALAQDYKLADDATINTAFGIGVGLTAYAILLGISHKDLHSIVENSGIKVIGEALSGAHKVKIYLKSEVDSLSDFQKMLINKSRSKVDNRGIGKINGVEVIAFTAYGSYLNCSSLKKWIDEAGILPIGKGVSGSNEVDLYPKNAVDNISELIEHLNIKDFEIDEKGLVNWCGTEGVGLNRYKSVLGMTLISLETAIADEGVRPLGKIKAGSNTIDIYQKSKIDDLPAVQSLNFILDEKGIVKIRKANCVALFKYSKYRDIGYQKLLDKTEEAGLIPFGFARSGKKPTPVYLKSEIDRLIDSL